MNDEKISSQKLSNLLYTINIVNTEIIALELKHYKLILHSIKSSST